MRSGKQSLEYKSPDARKPLNIRDVIQDAILGAIAVSIAVFLIAIYVAGHVRR